MADESVSLDLNLQADDLIDSSAKGTAALDKLIASMDHMNKMSTGTIKTPAAITGGSFIGPMRKDHAGMLSMLSQQEDKFASLKQRALNLGHSEQVASEFARKLMVTGEKSKGMLRSLGGELEEVSSLFGSAGGEVGEYGNKLSNVGNVLKGFAGKTGMLKLGLLGVGIAGVAAFAGLVEVGVKVAEVGFEFAKSASEAGRFAQETRLAMTQLLHGNAGEAGKLFDEVRRSAVGLGLDVNATVDSMKALLRTQFKPEMAMDIIKMGSDLQSVGVHAEEVQGVITAMSQIKSKGKLQGEELMQLQERGISGALVQDAIMKRMKLTSVSQYQKAQQGGKISADIAIPAIMDAVMKKTGESALGEAGAAYASGTITGQIAKMKGMVSNMMIDAGDAMMPGLVSMASLVTGTFERMMSSPEMQGIGAKMLGGFTTFVAWVEENWPRVEAMLPVAFGILGNVIDVVIGTIQFLLDNIDYVIAAAQMLGYTFMVFAAIGGIIVTAIAGIGTAIYAIGAGIWWLGEQIISFVEWVASVVPDWLQNLFGGSIGVSGNFAGMAGPAANDVTGMGSGGIKSGAASIGANGPPNVSNVKGDTNLHLNLTVPAPPGGTESDGEAYGAGVSRGIHRDMASYLGSAGENAA